MSTELARNLRRNATPPERAMWRLLHAFRQQGINFRRQVAIGTYIVDFACHRPAMVIECDGDTHGVDVQRANDAVRDDYLRGRGYRVLRFWNNDIMTNEAGVYAEIATALAEGHPPASPPTPAALGPMAQTPLPSPQGGGSSLRDRF